MQANAACTALREAPLRVAQRKQGYGTALGYKGRGYKLQKRNEMKVVAKGRNRTKKNLAGVRTSGAAKLPRAEKDGLEKDGVAATGDFDLRCGYVPFARQLEFRNSAAKYRLFGGAAGPGKTKALLWEAIRQAHLYATRSRWIRCCCGARFRSSKLRCSAISGATCRASCYKSYNDSKHVVTWLNGSTTRFGYSAQRKRYLPVSGRGISFHRHRRADAFHAGAVAIPHQPQSLPAAGRQPNMAGATNPGNIGHAWVKALWVDQRPAPGMDRPEQYDPSDYAFIRATLDDNPHLQATTPYRKTLEALPRHLRQAFLVGDWNVFAGQYFDLFDVRRHTRARRAAWDSSRGGRAGSRWTGASSIPARCYWHAARPDGAVLTYREFVANHLSPRMLAQAIAERSLDADGRFERIARSLSFAGCVRAAHFGIDRSPSNSATCWRKTACRGLSPADDDRVGGWMLMYQMLEQEQWVIAEIARAADRVPADADARSGECRGCAEVRAATIPPTARATG